MALTETEKAKMKFWESQAKRGVEAERELREIKGERNQYKELYHDVAEQEPTGLRAIIEKPVEREKIFKGNRKAGFGCGLHTEKGELRIPPGALTVLAAPTSHGKTMLTVNVALNAWKQGKKVLFLTMEEDRAAVALRMLKTHLELKTTDELEDKITELGDYEKVASFLKEKDALSEAQMVEYNRLTGAFLNNDICLRFYEEASTGDFHSNKNFFKLAGYDLIIIDYMQLLSLKKQYLNRNFNNRQEEVKHICHLLKGVAVETGIPIVLPAQFNREIDRKSKIYATKIGEAGDIERIAHLIVGIWNNTFPEYEQTDFSKENTIHYKILKNRGGRHGDSGEWKFDPDTGKIFGEQGVLNL